MLKAPSAERNKEVIAQVLLQYLNPVRSGFALEVGSGTGQHIIHFASRFPNITWLPSDIDEPSVASINCYLQFYQPKNVLQPIYVDASKPVNQWSPHLIPQSCDLVICINVIHISSLSVTQGLLQGAGAVLKMNGVLVTYGPYMIHGVISPESNVQFDKQLKLRDPEWGLRDVDYISDLAEDNGMKLEAMHDVPANNKMLIFRKIR
ncbi:methyltransferase-like 26 [Glandiceps talaboti]